MYHPSKHDKLFTLVLSVYSWYIYIYKFIIHILSSSCNIKENQIKNVPFNTSAKRIIIIKKSFIVDN